MTGNKRLLLGLIAFITTLCISSVAVSETAAEKQKREMAEMQRMLNAEIMAKPFEVAEMTRIDAYIAESMKKNLIPQPYKGTQVWKRGMTCTHLRGYRARRDCRYYQSYHGSYYPYTY